MNAVKFFAVIASVFFLGLAVIGGLGFLAGFLVFAAGGAMPLAMIVGIIVMVALAGAAGATAAEFDW